jgi:hypothetical protein
MPLYLHLLLPCAGVSMISWLLVRRGGPVLLRVGAWDLQGVPLYAGIDQMLVAGPLAFSFPFFDLTSANVDRIRFQLLKLTGGFWSWSIWILSLHTRN